MFWSMELSKPYAESQLVLRCIAGTYIFARTYRITETSFLRLDRFIFQPEDRKASARKPRYHFVPGRRTIRSELRLA